MAVGAATPGAAAADPELAAKQEADARSVYVGNVDCEWRATRFFSLLNNIRISVSYMLLLIVLGLVLVHGWNSTRVLRYHIAGCVMHALCSFLRLALIA